MVSLRDAIAEGDENGVFGAGGGGGDNAASAGCRLRGGAGAAGVGKSEGSGVEGIRCYEEISEESTEIQSKPAHSLQFFAKLVERGAPVFLSEAEPHRVELKLRNL